MPSTSLAKARTRLSALVDAAEHHGERIVILRHGKPAAAIVPVDAAIADRPEPMEEREAARSVQAFVSEFSAADPDFSAVDDLLRGRR